jgi:hypothetical protein
MVLIASIIFSLAFAAVLIKKGLYIGWVRLVNIVFSIYLSIFLTPSICSYSASINDTKYGYPLCLAIFTIVLFLILHGLTVTFFTGIFKVTFPKALNTAGSAILSFICGLLIWSFACFVLLLTPVPHHPLAQGLELPAQLVQASVPPLRLTCGFVNICSFQGEQADASKVLDSLLYVECEPRHKDRPRIKEELPAEANEVVYDGHSLLKTCKQHDF